MRAAVGLSVLALGIGVAATGCAVFPRRFAVELAGQGKGNPLVVVVVDRAGIASAASAERAGLRRGGGPSGVFTIANDPATLHVAWLGGMCDEGTTLDIADDGGVIVITEHTDRASACRDAGVLREIGITLSRPVDPSTTRFEPELGG